MSPPYLTFEIIFSILLLLPAIALIKFLVVCKSWCAIIKSQDFIKKHFETPNARGKNYILYGHTKNNHENFCYEHESRVQFDLPGMLSCFFVGSVNGLICLTDLNCFGHKIYLTNPSINKYLMLPPSSIYDDESDLLIIQVVLGFGYHAKTNDFKVVRIGFIEHEEDHEGSVSVPPPYGYDNFLSRVVVFSLNTKVWKALELSPNLSYKSYDMVSGVVVNECLHWDVIKSNGTYEDIYKVVILTFHLGEETFQEIEFSIYHEESAIDLSRCLGFKR
ncbi:hypothetical protein P3S67_019067 [Capsicum chacoense]